MQSDPLTLIEEPLTDAIDAQTIPLDGLYKELTSGRWVILSGERADIDQVSGVGVAELQMISGLSHGFDPNLPGDTVHTTLVLATPLAYSYKRDTLKIYGNVVKATHGATRRETLGSGDGADVFQSFVLKQPPVTFVAAPTAEGAESTLHVFVDNVEWHESESLDVSRCEEPRLRHADRRRRQHHGIVRRRPERLPPSEWGTERHGGL